MAGESVPPDVLAAFCGDPAHCTVSSLGHGNINDTFLVRVAASSFVLQKINSEVFPDPLRVIENFQKITAHLQRKSDGEQEQLQVASPVSTRDNHPWYRDDTGAFWRGQSYLPHVSCRGLTGPAQARRVGQALARFHRLAADLEEQALRDPLPGFHNLPGYLHDYDRTVRTMRLPGGEQSAFCQATIDRYRPQATTLEDARQAGILVLQPIHGDPKIDNFIFDEQGEVLGLLDLDTVAMGLVHHDLGDCLRSCCNRMGETGADVRSITFDLQLCRALLDGYFSGPKQVLNKSQREYIFAGVLLIAFELGLRFFTDYLHGNRYFKVRWEDENLQRAVGQFRLANDIAGKEEDIRAMTL
ncbi:phosphotransferase enzyme family protein [Desulfocastanea catecholica]